nr:hypothetical protein [Ferrimicrobium acidiphilum]
MSEPGEIGEMPNPNDSGPFRDGELLRDGVRRVRPDATLIQTIHTETHDSSWARFRNWALRNNIHVYLLFIIILFLAWYVPSRSYPELTDLVFGIVFAALIFTAPVAYEWEKRRDSAHIVVVDEWMSQFKEVAVGSQKTKNGVEQKVIVPETSRRAIYLGRDYQFDSSEPNRIEVKNAQVFDSGFAKVYDVSYVDPTGRIIVGEGSGDIPSGMVFKIAYPSRNELSKSVEKAERQAKEKAIPWDQFRRFKQAVDDYNHARDEVIRMAEKGNFELVDFEKLTRKQRTFFLALHQASLPFWTTDGSGKMGLGEWKALPPSIVMPKVLELVNVASEGQRIKLNYTTMRESDMANARIMALLDLATIFGLTHEALMQYALEQQKNTTAIPSSGQVAIEKEVRGGENDGPERQ